MLGPLLPSSIKLLPWRPVVLPAALKHLRPLAMISPLLALRYSSKRERINHASPRWM
jgi:hypothetical protein